MPSFGLYTSMRASITFSRSNCFKSEYFTGCLDALMMKEKRELYNEMVSIIG